MTRTGITAATAAALVFLGGCAGDTDDPGETLGADAGAPAADRSYGQPELPEPYATESAVRFARVVAWGDDAVPTAPAGFTVSRFADGLESPRQIYVLPNGDVLVAEANIVLPPDMPEESRALFREAGFTGTSADRITLLRDADGDGAPELREPFLTDLNQPFGMLLLDGRLYIGNTDALVAVPYEEGQTRITATPEKVADLPTGTYTGHWTRNVVAAPDGSRLYVSVGSQSNVDESGDDTRAFGRAAVLEMAPDGSGIEVYASGLRNPVGLAVQPTTGTLWTVVNERDGLGDELVPDYLTSVREDAFYGWPWSYWGQHVDPRKEGQAPTGRVESAIAPDFSLGSHVAPIGLTFYQDDAFPARFRGGAFIGLHGSWNRSELVGYQVAFVPFEGGRPAGELEPFLTGFIADAAATEVYGRPAGVAVAADGALLVADDAAGIIWRVAPE